MITDMIDSIILILAGGVVFYLGYQELGSWAAIREASPDGLSLTRPADDDFLPWPGIFTGVVWLGFYYWITNHVVVQKSLSARSIDHGRWGVLFAGFWQLPFLFILIIPGIMARALYPDLPEPDQVWAVLVFDLLPLGHRSLVFAALVAALTSTLDSVLNGAASLVVNDFVRTRERDFTDKQLLLISRVLIGAFMVLAALWAPQILRFEGIVEYFQSFFGHITMPVVVVVMGGIFWPRATRHAAFYTLVIAAPIGLAGFLGNEIFQLFDVQFLYATGIMLAFSLVLFITLSLLTEPPSPEQVRDVMWSRRLWRQDTEELRGTPFWKSYRTHALVLAVVTLVMVWIFR